MKSKNFNCNKCGKPNLVKPCKFHFTNHFCNKECQLLYMKDNANTVKCVLCKKNFKCSVSQKKLRNRNTCSRKCRHELRALNVEKNRKIKGMTKHQIDRSERYSKKVIEWRKLVFARDDYTCQMCFIRGKYIEADHIKPFAYFPELRHDINNGRTLCRECHKTTKIGYKKMREIYKPRL